jgi:hypothetical protein
MNCDKDAIALINGAFETQRREAVPPQLRHIFDERLRLASQLRARHLDIFADGLQDWMGLSAADVFGTRHGSNRLWGQCRVDALGQCDNGAPAARVRGQAFIHNQSVPSTLVITDSDGIIRGVARSARITPLTNRLFYQNKLTTKIGFIGYIRDYNPQLSYSVRSADNLTLSDEQIPVKH